jgi:hypothetical protein
LFVKSRFTTYFLATLLALVANFGVPVARIAVCRATGDIAWVENARRTQPDISEHRVIAAPVRPCTALAIPTDDPPILIAILDQSLFQRPPPPALLSRS